MKPQNGFNKKQKEEIEKIVRNEINTALKKFSNRGKQIENDVKNAVYSILDEQNEKMIDDIMKIQNKIDEKEVKKSIFAFGMKYLLHIFCIIAWITLILVLIAIIQLCYTTSLFLENPIGATILCIVYFFSIVILFIFHISIKKMNKSDSYNSLMFIITIIAFMITIISVLQ